MPLPPFVALAVLVPPLLVVLTVRRRAEAGRLARLFRAQEQWAAAMDRDRPRAA